MGKEMIRPHSLFNSPLEIGLRSTSILCEGFPEKFSIQQLIYLDYLVVHSDDIDGGPIGLHPKTPFRSGEILIRRKSLEKGLMLYMSRGLIAKHYTNQGIYYSATEQTAVFLDSLITEYVILLRESSRWIIEYISNMTESDLGYFIQSHLCEWGAEFELESILWWDEKI